MATDACIGYRATRERDVRITISVIGRNKTAANIVLENKHVFQSQCMHCFVFGCRTLEKSVGKERANGPLPREHSVKVNPRT